MTIDPKAAPDSRIAYVQQRVQEWNKDGAPIFVGSKRTESTLDRIVRQIRLGGPNGDCWEWTGARSPRGYGKTIIGRGAARKDWRVHRAVWMLVYGEIDDKALICHKCDHPPCCNPRHLFVGTQKENIADMLSKGRRHNNKGSKHGLAKLTEQQVSELRTLRRSGWKLTELASRYGVTFQYVSYVSRFGWEHVA
jgi:hypothetical protein